MIRKLLKLAVALIILLLLAVIGLYIYLARQPEPEYITYGASFTKLYSDELGLDWKEVYTAALDELGIRHFRLAAHWPMIEPQKDTYDFSVLDEQIRMAEERDAKIILAIGRRLPRWPECHVPLWTVADPWDSQKKEILEYMTAVVERYKDRNVIEYWQVENEPFLDVFANEWCGDLDEAFLDEEIALVRQLDPEREILITDSGNLGMWAGAYKRGDAFGTSVYVYVSNDQTGPIKSFLPASFYRVKRNLMAWMYGEKETMLIELSTEPWLEQSIVDTPIPAQLERMNLERFNEVIAYARNTRMSSQYVWGIEWWYWMKKHGYPEFWDTGKQLFLGR